MFVNIVVAGGAFAAALALVYSQNRRARRLAFIKTYPCHPTLKRKMVAMPSQVVDEAWHEFILFIRAYQAFCSKAPGRSLHHTPAEAMKAPTLARDGIKRA